MEFQEYAGESAKRRDESAVSGLHSADARDNRYPTARRWVHEVNFDGYRVQVHIASSDIKVFTRRGHDWTNRFRKVAEDAWHLNIKSAIIDGEVIAPSAGGVSDFSVLQKTLRSKKASQELQMYAFDLPYLNGYDLRTVPLLARKAELLRVIKGSGIFYSEHFEIDGTTMFKRACAMGIEGIVSKVHDSRYQSDRTSNWLKVTCQQRETLRIVGYGLKNGRFDGSISAGKRKAPSFTPARSTTASHPKVQPISSGG